VATVDIRYDGVSIIDDVELKQSSFTSKADGNVGQALIRVRDTQHAYAPGYFKQGKTLELFVDGSRSWDGWVFVVRRGWQFDVDDTTNPVATPRYWTLMGLDRNLLFLKRFLYNVANPADDGGLKIWPRGTSDLTALTYALANYVDLTGDGIDVASGLRQISSPGPYEEFTLGHVSANFGSLFADAQKITGGVFAITPDRVLSYRGDTDVDAPFALVDAPIAGAHAFYRELEFADEFNKGATEALVWGAGKGSGEPVFAKYRNQEYVDEYGLWQWGDRFPGAWKQKTVRRRAETYVEGSPDHRVGHGEPVPEVKLTIFDHGIRAGMVASVHVATFGISDRRLPVREVRMTFPTPTSVRYDLTLSLTIDTPFGIPDLWDPTNPWAYTESIPIGGDPVYHDALIDDFDRPGVIPYPELLGPFYNSGDSTTMVGSLPVVPEVGDIIVIDLSRQRYDLGFLNQNINDSQTSFSVRSVSQDADTWPAPVPPNAQFHIKIDDEWMLVTAQTTGSTPTLTVVRGAQGTSPAAHTDGDAVLRSQFDDFDISIPKIHYPQSPLGVDITKWTDGGPDGSSPVGGSEYRRTVDGTEGWTAADLSWSFVGHEMHDAIWWLATTYIIRGGEEAQGLPPDVDASYDLFHHYPDHGVPGTNPGAYPHGTEEMWINAGIWDQPGPLAIVNGAVLRPPSRTLWVYTIRDAYPVLALSAPAGWDLSGVVNNGVVSHAIASKREYANIIAQDIDRFSESAHSFWVGYPHAFIPAGIDFQDTLGYTPGQDVTGAPWLGGNQYWFTTSSLDQWWISNSIVGAADDDSFGLIKYLIYGSYYEPDGAPGALQPWGPWEGPWVPTFHFRFDGIPSASTFSWFEVEWDHTDASTPGGGFDAGIIETVRVMPWYNANGSLGSKLYIIRGSSIEWIDLPFTIKDGVDYVLRVDFALDRLRVRLWEADEEEPSQWHYEGSSADYPYTAVAGVPDRNIFSVEKRLEPNSETTLTCTWDWWRSAVSTVGGQDDATYVSDESTAAGLYVTRYPYQSGTLELWTNGRRLRRGVDFWEVSPATGEFRLGDVRDLASTITAKYIRYGDALSTPTNTTGGAVYRPAPVLQYGWGSRLDGYNCTMACACMALDRHTKGRYTQRSGDPKATPPVMRSYQDDQKGGTDLFDVSTAWDRGWDKVLHSPGTHPWNTFVDKINQGRGAILQGQYGNLPASKRFSSTFTKGHAIYINEQFSNGNFWGVDPLTRHPIVYTPAELQAYAEGLSFVKSGYVSAAFTGISK